MLNRNLHMSLLQDLLRKIFLNRNLASRLAFKGGTALLLFHGLDRFSTDLDFDLLDEKANSDYIYQSLINYGKQIGEIKEADSNNGPKSIRVIISYKNDATANIKLDVSKRKSVSNYEIQNLLGMQFKVMVKEDIFAHKLVAITDRINRTNRDLYDAYFMLSQNWSFNETIIESRLDKSFQAYLPSLIRHVEKTDRRHILSGLGEILDPERKLWVKEKLLDELLYKLKQLESLSS